MKKSHNVGPNGEIVDFCTTCRHAVKRWGFSNGLMLYCAHPLLVSPVDGAAYRKCEHLRDGQASPCGTYGSFHEPAKP